MVGKKRIWQEIRATSGAQKLTDFFLRKHF
jgi:hypothetical protein